jgi:rare lipoprotein A
MTTRSRSSSRGWWVLATLGIVTLVLLLAAKPADSAADRAAAQPATVQWGLASFYGPGFHGEETASGEIFDQWQMVAAHRSLPLGSVVRVTNLENNRQVVLRVIDRGPYGRNFRKGTIIDVSKGAARRLDFITEGLVRVRIDVLRLGDNAR